MISIKQFLENKLVGNLKGNFENKIKVRFKVKSDFDLNKLSLF